jgi:hypothetical protein
VSRGWFDLDATGPGLGVFDLDGDLAASEWDELAWVLRVRLLKIRDSIDGSPVNDVYRLVALLDDFCYIPVIELFKVAILDLPAAGWLYGVVTRGRSARAFVFGPTGLSTDG